MASWEIAEVLGRLPNSSNATLLARTTDETLVVYKPARGERPLWDFDHGTLAAREVLTFEVSAAAGLDLVPTTVLGDGPFGAGSLQAFVEEDFAFDPVEMINEGAEALWPVAVLDLLINNADRKAGHVIAEKGSARMWCIDHGVTFHAEPKLRTVLWAFAGRSLPEEMLEAIRRVLATMRSGLHERIATLLSHEEADAAAARAEALLDQPVHPHPPIDRPAVPWPVW